MKIDPELPPLLKTSAMVLAGMAAAFNQSGHNATLVASLHNASLLMKKAADALEGVIREGNGGGMRWRDIQGRPRNS